jgi:hypothetical protein
VTVLERIIREVASGQISVEIDLDDSNGSFNPIDIPARIVEVHGLAIHITSGMKVQYQRRSALPLVHRSSLFQHGGTPQ